MSENGSIHTSNSALVDHTPFDQLQSLAVSLEDKLAFGMKHTRDAKQINLYENQMFGVGGKRNVAGNGYVLACIHIKLT